MTFLLGDESLNSNILAQIAYGFEKDLQVSKGSDARLRKYRDLVNKALASKKTFYGINTGFGFLSDVSIDESQLDELQRNLVRSHACGVGDYAAPEVSRGLLALRLHTFYLGHTGISSECVSSILRFSEKDILPAIPIKGSVGASGDLAPLAHLALSLMGEGYVYYKGELVETSHALQSEKLTAYKLKAKGGVVAH